MSAKMQNFVTTIQFKEVLLSFLKPHAYFPFSTNMLRNLSKHTLTFHVLMYVVHIYVLNHLNSLH